MISDSQHADEFSACAAYLERVPPVDGKKVGSEVRVAATGRFVTVARPSKPLTKEGMSRVHDALSAASEKTGAFRSRISPGYGARKLPPKSK